MWKIVWGCGDIDGGSKVVFMDFLRVIEFVVISNFVGDFVGSMCCFVFEFGFDVIIVSEFWGWDFVDVVIFGF